ncbi:GLPGLI family protein [Kaistella montana]|uniref:GLPGLI family protein n=1 Tax=Kaistella montana TaxID=1849733 RepID=A0ABW5K5R3_9FLAO|nr:GLPGLI family protein [Kaistella montana]MCQ4034519.1 GLPGLI family protein [Kaistella montana]
MKNLTFTILFILCSQITFAQTNRFIYEMKYRNNPAEAYRTDLMTLDINKDEVKFYDYEFVKYDSLNKRGNEYSSRYSTKSDQVLVRKFNTNKNLQYRDFFDYFKVISNDEMKWKLLPETQTIDGYKLQKATTQFGGRDWTAWFAKDINISEGPYKFRGLPGLIFSLEDSDKDFSYRLIKNIKLTKTFDTKDFVETHYGKPALPVTNAKFNEYIQDIYVDPVRMFSSQIKDGGKASFKNETVESVAELNKKKQMLQNGIKGRYIFIEKDKAPVFK